MKKVEENILRKTFGMWKTKKSTEQLMKELDEELWFDDDTHKNKKQ